MADAEKYLIQAAFKLGESYKPGDYTAIFNKQYEGLTEFYKQKGAAWGNITFGALKGITTFQKARWQKEHATDAADTISDDAATSATSIEEAGIDLDNMLMGAISNGITSLHEGYKKGDPLPEGFQKTGRQYLEDIKAELETLRNENFLNKEQRERQTELRQKAEKFKSTVIDEKASIVSATTAAAERHINWDRAFINDREKGLVLKQVLDKNFQGDKYGTNTLRDINGETWVEYYEGVPITSEYLNNLENEQPKFPGQVDFEVNVSGTESGPSHQVDEDGEKIVKKRFKLSDALKELKDSYKDIKSVNKHNDIQVEALKTYSKRLEGSPTDVMVYEYDNWDDEGGLGNSVYSSIKSSLLEADIETGEYANIADITTRSIEIDKHGTANYKEALWQDDSFLHKLKYKDLGLPAGLDKDGDGFLDDDELIGQHTKKSINEMLTNPKTNDQREVAAHAFAKWRTNIIGQIAKDQRERQNPERPRKIIKGPGYKYKNVKVEVGGGESGIPKGSMWSDDIIRLQDRFKEIQQRYAEGKGAKWEKVEFSDLPENRVEIHGQHFQYLPNIRAWAKVFFDTKKNRWLTIRTKGKMKGGEFKSIQEIFDDMNIDLQTKRGRLSYDTPKLWVGDVYPRKENEDGKEVIKYYKYVGDGKMIEVPKPKKK